MDHQYPPFQQVQAPPPEQMLGGPPAPGGRSSKKLIIVLVIAALSLCCCASGVLFYILGSSDGGTVSSGSVSTTPAPPQASTPPNPAPSGDLPAAGDHLAAWTAFSPTLGAPGAAADARQEQVARDVMALLMPEFEVVEVRVFPGGVSEDDPESFLADMLLVRLRSTRDPSVELAYDFLAACREGDEAEAEWVTEDLDADQVLETLPSGTEYVYWTDWFPELLDGTATDDYHALLAQVAADWPGGVDTWVDWLEEDGMLTAWAYPTTWEQYVDEQPFSGFEAAYELRDGEWVLTTWAPWELESE